MYMVVKSMLRTGHRDKLSSIMVSKYDVLLQLDAANLAVQASRPAVIAYCSADPNPFPHVHLEQGAFDRILLVLMHIGSNVAVLFPTTSWGGASTSCARLSMHTGAAGLSHRGASAARRDEADHLDTAL